MKALVSYLLCCLSVFAAGTNEIQVVTRTDTKVTPGYLVTYDTFTRGGQTNLLRITTAKDGVTNNVAHIFLHKGARLGTYSHSQSLGNTFINSEAGAPYRLSFVLGSSNQVMAASVATTNYVIVDSFTYTNGTFNPVSSSAIEESNKGLRDVLHR
jgi:hypothetical protein